MLAPTFDFSKEAINATSGHVTLNPGDKILWHKQHRRSGAGFQVRCYVVKATKTTVRVLCRWVNRQTGEIETAERTVARRNITRFDWPERN